MLYQAGRGHDLGKATEQARTTMYPYTSFQSGSHTTHAHLAYTDTIVLCVFFYFMIAYDSLGDDRQGMISFPTTCKPEPLPSDVTVGFQLMRFAKESKYFLTKHCHAKLDAGNDHPARSIKTVEHVQND